MSTAEPTSTYLELRESTASGDESAGLSHNPGGMFLLHVQELAAYGEPAGGVTLVHDAGDHGGRYLDAAQVLAEGGWAVALPDLRGHGKSEGARGHSSGVREVVRDLTAVQEHLAYRLPVAPKVLVGQGLGALYALAFAVESPGQIAALVLLAPLLDPRFDLPKPAGGLMKMFKKIGPETPGSIGFDPAQRVALGSDELVHDVITVGAGQQAVEIARSYPPRLGSVGVPVLVVHGADDSIASPQASRGLEGAGVEVRVKDGLRHDLLHAAQGKDVAAEILTWIAATVS